MLDNAPLSNGTPRRPRTPDSITQPRPRTPGLAHAPPHPQLPNNVARNSPAPLSRLEIRSLKSCGFREVSKWPRQGITCEISKLSTDFSNSSHEATQSSMICVWISTKSYVNGTESPNYRACATQSSLPQCSPSPSDTTEAGSTTRTASLSIRYALSYTTHASPA